IPYKKTKQTLVWNRVPQHDLINHPPATKPLHSTTTHHCPQVPTVRTTLPEADLVPSRAEDSSAVPSIASKQTANPFSGQPRGQGNLAALQPNIPIRPLPCLPKEPRKFHFAPAATTSKSSPVRPSSVRHGGIQKHRKRQKKDFAVFVERKCHPGKLNSATHHGSGIFQGDDGAAIEPTAASHQPSSPRKRPLASPAERKWRAQTWKQPLSSTAHGESAIASSPASAVATEDDPDSSLALAQELQQFAFEETYRVDHTHPLTTKLGPKFMPNPPKPRLTKKDADTRRDSNQLHNDKMELEDDEDDTDTFVIDVYVRQPEKSTAEETVASPKTSLETAEPDKVGLLVVDDEDQETWELFGAEEQSSDDAWSSDEEDENAEDYYGNDYPEDELDSGDEHGNTYRYWHGASDEEHLDGNVDWSDEEPQAKNMWESG
ncbi:MAG: hypothetical protein Q9169_001961, partial [Polycauliona sp. 2 TL-2023]